MALIYDILECLKDGGPEWTNIIFSLVYTKNKNWNKPKVQYEDVFNIIRYLERKKAIKKVLENPPHTYDYEVFITFNGMWLFHSKYGL